nr:uncharacterized protein LOC110439898 [Danio rerio]|eukprot:XP_021333283.1 uncharacterized protein LOC110439898 [Danio rerio]
MTLNSSLPASGPTATKFPKEQFPLSPDAQTRALPVFQLAAPGPLASGSQSAAERTPFSHSGLIAGSREEGKRNSLIFSSSSGRTACRDEHSHPELPLLWHVSNRSDGAISAHCIGLISAAQCVAVAHTNGQTRLCDSVCYSPSQVHGCPFHKGYPRECPVLREEIAVLLAKDTFKQVPSANEVRVLQPIFHRAQTERWVKANPKSAQTKLSFIQNAFHNAHSEMLDSERQSTGLVCSDRPEGCMFSRLHSSTPPPFSPVRFRRTSVAIQSPPLQALSVYAGFHQARGGCPSAWHVDMHWVRITLLCLRTLSPLTDLVFLRAGVLLGLVSRHVVVSMRFHGS